MKIEAAIQKSLVAWIKTTYPDTDFVITENERKNFNQLTAQLGIPDLIIFKPLNNITHILFLEIKKINGKLSKSEINWRDNIYKPCSNTQYFTGYGYLECQNKIKEFLDN